MQRFNWFPGGLVVGVAMAGCSQDLTFSDRASHATIQQAAQLSAGERGPIAVNWNPATFPERVDKKGPSGNEGALTRAHIPIGMAIAGRLDEVLDAAVGVNRSSPNVLTVSVIEADAEYRFATGMITSRHIASGSTVFEAEFSLGQTQWSERFSAQARFRPEIDGAQGTGVLNRVWDDIALQVATSVVEKDWVGITAIGASPATTPNAVPPGGPAGTDPRLRRVIEAWPQLNDAVRDRIAGLVEGAGLLRSSE
jgi:hypothetical protein